MNESKMDAKGGYDMADAGGYMPDPAGARPRPTPVPPKTEKMVTADITSAVYESHEYEVCDKIGKAVIVSNFMDPSDKKPYQRTYAQQDCDKLTEVLERLGFEPLSGYKNMVHKNVTKEKFEELYRKAAQENYRPRDAPGYTCVLFIVMSYGRPGLIKCHDPKNGNKHEYVEQKLLQEAFQPQNNISLALKPKLFIVQTIPEEESVADGDEKDIESKTTKRIPREADFLSYTCDSFCIARNEEMRNTFVRAIVEVLNQLAADKDNKLEALEIQKLLIRMNYMFKKYRGDRDWKIPCVTSSLTKQLRLFKSQEE